MLCPTRSGSGAGLTGGRGRCSGPERPFCWWASPARRLCPPGGGGGLGQLPRVWVGGPADTLTSLGAAGVLMCLGNGYAVYDVGFELSFAAVMGTLAGAECAGRGRERYYDRKKKQKSRREKPSRAVLLFRRFAGGVWDSLCVSLCASAATSGAGAAGDEHDGLGCGVGRGRPLAGGADAELRPRCSSAGSGRGGLAFV